MTVIRQVPSSSSSTGSAELVLSVRDPAHLFQAPPVDPTSGRTAEVLGLSGVDHLLELLNVDRKLQRARRLVLQLPAEEAAHADAAGLEESLHRLATARMERLEREVRATRSYGQRVLGLAVLMLAVCLAIASVFAGELTEGMRPLVRKTFEYGFEIIGWVILWHPIEVLAFTPLALRYRIGALKTLASAEVVVRNVG